MNENFKTCTCLRRGLNPGSSVYETDALPLGHRGLHKHGRHLYVIVELFAE